MKSLFFLFLFWSLDCKSQQQQNKRRADSSFKITAIQKHVYDSVKRLDSQKALIKKGNEMKGFYFTQKPDTPRNSQLVVKQIRDSIAEQDKKRKKKK